MGIADEIREVEYFVKLRCAELRVVRALLTDIKYQLFELFKALAM